MSNCHLKHHMVIKTLHGKIRMCKHRMDQVSAEYFTRNSNKFVSSLRPPQQMMSYAIKKKTRDQSVN